MSLSLSECDWLTAVEVPFKPGLGLASAFVSRLSIGGDFDLWNASSCFLMLLLSPCQCLPLVLHLTIDTKWAERSSLMIERPY